MGCGWAFGLCIFAPRRGFHWLDGLGGRRGWGGDGGVGGWVGEW